MSRMGRMLTTAAAVSRLYSMKYMWVKLISPMETTFIWGLLITTIGQKNSFQFHINLMISREAMAGLKDATITSNKIRSSQDPSMRAGTKEALGITKNARSIRKV